MAKVIAILMRAPSGKQVLHVEISFPSGARTQGYVKLTKNGRRRGTGRTIVAQPEDADLCAGIAHAQAILNSQSDWEEVSLISALPPQT